MILLVSGNVAFVSRVAADGHRGRLGHITTPRNGNAPASLAKTGLPWALDNGAYSGFDPDLFRRLLRRCVGLPRLLWVVCPDVVRDGPATLALWHEWSPELVALGLPTAYVLQDGQESLPLPDAGCYFIGGSDRWRRSPHVPALAAAAKRRGAWLHLGRVNSMRRLRWALRLGCDSVDGSSYSRWQGRASRVRPDMRLERHLRFLAAAERDLAQPTLFGEGS